jgi:hypothetical protein
MTKSAIFGLLEFSFIFFLPLFLLSMETATGKLCKGFQNSITLSIVNLQKYLVPEMNNVSAQAKDLIKKILVPRGNRISIEEIYKHPWMTDKVS